MVDTRRPDSAVDRIRERVAEKAARRAAAAARKSGEDSPARPGGDSPSSRPGPAAEDARLPGVGAEKPTDIPARGWKQILKRAWAENKADNMPIIGGGVAFFGFLAIFPLTFASSAFVPTDSMPDWLQAFADINPFTIVVNAVRALWLDAPADNYVWGALAWTLGLIAVFAPLAVRAYRRAALRA